MIYKISMRRNRENQIVYVLQKQVSRNSWANIQEYKDFEEAHQVLNRLNEENQELKFMLL